VDLQQLIDRLQRAQIKNAKLQDKLPKASSDWHTHEDIDDELHEALTVLEAKLENEEEQTNV
jgi:hypothetical protein